MPRSLPSPWPRRSFRLRRLVHGPRGDFFRPLPTRFSRVHTSGRLFLGGRVTSAGTVTKTGSGDVVLSHTEGASDQNSVGTLENLRRYPEPAGRQWRRNPLGANATVEINGGSTNYGLFLNSDGDGTAAAK